MRFLKRVAGFLGFGHDPKNNNEDDNNNANNRNSSSSNDDVNVRRNRTNVEPIPGGPRKGFSVPVQVPVERPVGPVIVQSNGDGGVQGLRWYAKQLRIDEDGDVADEFLEQVLPETSDAMQNEHRPTPRFQVKNNVRHARVKRQVLRSDGKFLQAVECQGEMLLV